AAASASSPLDPAERQAKPLRKAAGQAPSPPPPPPQVDLSALRAACAAESARIARSLEAIAVGMDCHRGIAAAAAAGAGASTSIVSPKARTARAAAEAGCNRDFGTGGGRFIAAGMSLSAMESAWPAVSDDVVGASRSAAAGGSRMAALYCSARTGPKLLRRLLLFIETRLLEIGMADSGPSLLRLQ
ncbi:unnamed protein product, partial [Phaeothamnion confervicola]